MIQLKSNWSEDVNLKVLELRSLNVVALKLIIIHTAMIVPANLMLKNVFTEDQSSKLHMLIEKLMKIE